MAKPSRTEVSQNGNFRPPWAYSEADFLRDCLKRENEGTFLVAFKFKAAIGERRVMEAEVFRFYLWIREWPGVTTGRDMPLQSSRIIGGPLYQSGRPEVEAYAIFLRIGRGDCSPQQLMELLATYLPSNQEIAPLEVLSVNLIARRFIRFFDSPHRIAAEKLSAEIVAIGSQVNSIELKPSGRVAALGTTISDMRAAISEIEIKVSGTKKRVEKFKTSFWFKELVPLSALMTSYRKLVDGLGKLATEDLYTLPPEPPSAD